MFDDVDDDDGDVDDDGDGDGDGDGDDERWKWWHCSCFFKMIKTLRRVGESHHVTKKYIKDGAKENGDAEEREEWAASPSKIFTLRAEPCGWGEEPRDGLQFWRSWCSF